MVVVLKLRQQIALEISAFYFYKCYNYAGDYMKYIKVMFGLTAGANSNFHNKPPFENYYSITPK